ncbi:MAG: HAMP domain-containing histidine kinase [Deltaproteobacteria bacterium]|nr:HAMP domain-containing histidine kinase [Deltaproteobacteria bacterium]
MSCDGEVVGVLINGWRNRADPFRPRERHLATGIANATAVALDTAQLVAELQMANRMKSEFLANMSHELRTPINVIAGYADMLNDGAFGDVTSEAHDVLARVRSTTRTLRDLVATTLHLGHLEAGRDAIDVETVDVEALLRELASEIVASPAITLHWPEPSLALHVSLDRGKLRTILQQLIQNAVKFTDAGRVTIAIEHDGQYLTVTVEDTGVGIPQDRLADLFQPFRQLDGSNTRRHGGVGLGLHLVKRLVVLLRGDVRVTSQPGRGSTFVVTLPAPRAGAPESPLGE